jgi:hypothetical protein
MSAAAWVEQSEFWHQLNPVLDFPLRVVPVKPQARVPYYRGWEFGKIRKNGRYGSSSTTDRGRLLKVTETDPRPGIAVPTGQPVGNGYLLVLDVDAENGGLESWSTLCGALGEPPPTATVLTKTESCFHKHFISQSQWLDAPKELGPGLEVKRATQLVMVPPTHGYSWAQAPWQEMGIWSWNELDAYLGSVIAVPEIVVPGLPAHLNSWGAVDDHLRAIASASPGGRNEALLRYGGKVAYATASGRGLAGPEAVRVALWQAAHDAGLTGDYDEEELGRKVEVYVRWSDPGQNPLLSQAGFTGQYLYAPLCPPEDSKVFAGRGGQAEKIILTDLARFARHEYKAYAKRWAMKSTGLAPETVREALKRLIGKSLIEQGPSLPNDGRRATHTYRLTAKGRSLFVAGGAA